MRARNIKPGFFKNEDLAECSIPARLMFPGLWMMADRMGRLEYRPKRIKGELFPFDNIDAQPLLDELNQWGLIKFYEVDGRKLIWIPCFLAHQNPHRREKASDLPRHPDDKNEEKTPSDDDNDRVNEQPRTDPGPTLDKPRPDQGQTQTIHRTDPDHTQDRPRPDLGQTQAQPRPDPARLNPESLILNPRTNIAFSSEKAQGDPVASSPDPGPDVLNPAEPVQNGLRPVKSCENGLKSTKHFSGRLVLKHKPTFENKKILDEIIGVCRKIEALPKRQSPFNPFQWVQMQANQRGHPMAILDTLKGLSAYWDSTESPFSYASSIMKTKGQNYNEQDHILESDAFKAIMASPEVMAMFQVKGFGDGYKKAHSGS